MIPKTVIGVDPGQTTGIFLTSGEHFRGHYQAEKWGAMHTFHDLLWTWRPDAVVIEQFNVMEARTALAGTDIQWPIDIIGAAKWECMKCDWDLTVTGQWNWQRKKITDEMLEERGWLARPATVMRHSNDAARHVLRYLIDFERRNRT